MKAGARMLGEPSGSTANRDAWWSGQRGAERRGAKNAEGGHRRGTSAGSRLIGLISIWVIFVVLVVFGPAQSMWANGTLAQKVLGGIGIAGIAVCYLVLLVTARRLALIANGLPAPWAALALCVESVFVAMLCVGAGSAGLSGLILVGVTSVLVLHGRQRWKVPVVLTVIGFVAPRVVPGWEPEDWLAISVLLSSAASMWFAQLVARNRQLVEAEREVAALAVNQERDRIARDMHDVLGHSLSVIAVKSELAERLVDRDPAKAQAELSDIADLTRSALSDVRAMISGIRSVSLSGQLASAREVFDAAGIEATLPNTTDMVPERLRSLFAWTLREGTTNILRHAEATAATVTLGPDSIVIDDNGRGPGAADDRSSGLAGLRERAEAVGAHVQTGRSPLGGFRLTVCASGHAVSGATDANERAA